MLEYYILSRFLEAIISCSVIIYLLCSIPLFYVKKIKCNSQTDDNIVARFNNSRSNLDLANSLTNGGLILAFICHFIAAPYLWNTSQVVYPTVISVIIMIGMASVGFSLKLIISKPEIIEHIKAHMCFN